MASTRLPPSINVRSTPFPNPEGTLIDQLPLNNLSSIKPTNHSRPTYHTYQFPPPANSHHQSSNNASFTPHPHPYPRRHIPPRHSRRPNSQFPPPPPPPTYSPRPRISTNLQSPLAALRVASRVSPLAAAHVLCGARAASCLGDGLAFRRQEARRGGCFGGRSSWAVFGGRECGEAGWECGFGRDVGGVAGWRRLLGGTRYVSHTSPDHFPPIIPPLLPRIGEPAPAPPPTPSDPPPLSPPHPLIPDPPSSLQTPSTPPFVPTLCHSTYAFNPTPTPRRVRATRASISPTRTSSGGRC